MTLRRGLALACTVLLLSAAAQARPGDDDAAASSSSPRPPGEVLLEARALYEGLEYDQVIPLAETVLAHPDTTIEQRLDAYLLQGSALAIVGNPIDAEKPFRFLLRGRPDFDMDATTPPKILAVFRKVQVEERSIRQQMAELERARVIESLRLEGEDPADLQGGLPVPFRYTLRDPRGVTATVRVLYRRGDKGDFSSLALERLEGGEWVGELPGEWSENEDGFELQYFITTADAAGQPLVGRGSLGQPLVAPVAPGSVGDTVPFYRSVWFWGLAGAAAMVGIASVATSAGAIGYLAVQLPPSDLGTVYID